ncbi:MAG: cysteine hydrolase [Microbacteriaceae bacterium]|nr:cysteine hydrolase [Microbacteriaceae bacterium]
MTKRALIVIDVQKGFSEWDVKGERNNPACEENVARLISAWREKNQPIVFVKHNSKMPTSVLRPGQPGNDFKDVITGTPDLLVEKSVNSAFYGEPDLYKWLKANDIGSVAICGIQTNMCCETTARMAGNLGLDTWFVLDATHTFAKTVGDTKISAEELSLVTSINLAGEFAGVISTAEAEARL